MIAELMRPFEALWTGVGAHLWQTSLVLLLIALLARTLSEAPRRLVATFWGLAALKLLLPLQLLGPFAGRWLPAPAALPSAGSDRATAVVRVWLWPVGSVAEPESARPWLAWPLVLTAVWLAGIVALAWVARSRTRRAGPVAGCRSPRVAGALNAAARACGIPPESVRAVETSRLPWVSGLWRPVIAMPVRASRALPEIELRAVLLHEDAHRRHRDPLRSTGVWAAAVLFFFYPPVWWLSRRFHEATETACDDAVLAAGVPAPVYRRALARMLSLDLEIAPTPASLFGVRESLTVRRLARLASHGRYTMATKHRLAIVSALLAVVAGSFLPLTSEAPPDAETVPAETPRRAGSLDGLARADLPVIANFRSTPASEILEAFGAVADVEFELAAPFVDKDVDLSLGRLTLVNALSRLADEADLAFQLVQPDRVRVRSRVHIAGNGGITMPKLLAESRVKPDYPERMRVERLEGRVILQAVIDQEGRVSAIEVLSDSRPGYPELAEAAVEAVSQWRYEPATSDGVPVNVYFTVVVEFELSDSTPDPDEAI